MAIFKGAGVAIATPFKENGEVNYEEFGRLIEFQIENGTDAIIVCGTTGEAATMTEEEHMDVVKYCIDKVAKRVPVIAGTGSNCTETAIKLSTRKVTKRRLSSGVLPGPCNSTPVSVERLQLLCLPLPFTPPKGFSCNRQRKPCLRATLRISIINSML